VVRARYFLLMDFLHFAEKDPASAQSEGE